MMNLDKAIGILQKHNELRKGESDDPPEPFLIDDAIRLGIAIDTVIIAAKERIAEMEQLAKSCVIFFEGMR